MLTTFRPILHEVLICYTKMNYELKIALHKVTKISFSSNKITNAKIFKTPGNCRGITNDDNRK